MDEPGQIWPPQGAAAGRSERNAEPPNEVGTVAVDSRSIERLRDVEVRVSVEVGARRMALSEVLALVPGSLVPLDKKADEPVDLRVNGTLIARGEVVMVDDVYGVRITHLVDPRGRGVVR